MGKRIVGLIIAAALIVFLPLFAFASNRVDSIDVEAVIESDGSLYITQIWQGRFDEGTEVYIPMNAPSYLTISNLSVSDQYGAYETDLVWNVNRSFNEKARRCGINRTDGGYEICFGISQYADNRYTIKYKLDNAVGGYPDRDGVNFRFVNDRMNTTPTDVTVKIRLADGTPINDRIADIWGFGFSGEVVFENGAIVARTNKPIGPQNHVTVMFSLDKGILSPARLETVGFEKIKEAAFEGSDYDTADEQASLLVALLSMLLFIGIPIGTIIWGQNLKKKRAKKELKKFFDRSGYFRDIPNEENLSASYELARTFDLCEDGAVLATGILRLIQFGCLSPVEVQKTGFMGKTKETVNLHLLGIKHDKMNEYDEYLYTVLEAAAGSDSILQAKELERYASKNDKLLRAYIKKHESEGRAYLSQKNCLKRRRKPARISDLTLSGEKELGELLGLKKYLEDFSLIAERGVKEIAIWRELLTYAMLFGIADKVSAQMKELYPQISSDLDSYTRSMSTAYSYHYLLYNNMRKAEQRREQKARSSGSGGFSSFGGGGGSIGGGSGGGTR